MMVLEEQALVTTQTTKPYEILGDFWCRISRFHTRISMTGMTKIPKTYKALRPQKISPSISYSIHW